MMYFQLENGQGLNVEEALSLQKKYGKNKIHLEAPNRFINLIWGIIKEPMFLLLLGACLLYFILGEANEGFMMIAAMCFVAAISVYQEFRSSKALQALRELTEPLVTVIRSNKELYISSEDLVPGDIMVLSEGEKIPADAIIIQSNDFSVNEGIITGEAFPVTKNHSNNTLFQGSIVNSGKCYAQVTAIGNHTFLGKLGKSIIQYQEIRTALQEQIGRLVRGLALFGLAAFLIIFIFNYLKDGNLIASLLFGLTLAMAAIPEEIPVAFSSFMALGAYHMSRRGMIVRQPMTVESLGAVTTICLDKTGTITENKMAVKFIYDFKQNCLIDIEKSDTKNSVVLFFGALASEVNPFDEMEKAIWKAYRGSEKRDATLEMIHEYPLDGHPPMMTHVYEKNNQKIVAGKGAAERILNVCKIVGDERTHILQQVKDLASQGFRILGVASAKFEGNDFPYDQNDFNWEFHGLLALYDPPRKEVAGILSVFRKAGIEIKLITGDYLETAENIARQVGLAKTGGSYTGEEVMKMSEPELKDAVKKSSLFARMFPEAKLKLIEALKENNEIVAMTGDGVNDGPAIKAAHIGIAMGKKGTEVARQASDLIITDDNLGKIAEAILQGRRIFSNLKKAVRYIISIHIPIILTASLPLIIGWKYPNIFTPIHVIFLELIMGPTCSIFYEREPAEQHIMKMKPRSSTGNIFTRSELLISVVQGLIITCGVLSLYYFYMQAGTLEETRTIVFIFLVCSNIFLTFTNRSFTETIIKTSQYKNSLVFPFLIISIALLLVLLFIPPVREVFGMQVISIKDFFICLITAFASVFWFEAYKANLKQVVL